MTIRPAQANSFINLPNWGTCKYYFASTHLDSASPADDTLGQDIQIINIAVPVPEPGTYAAAFALGALGLWSYVRRPARHA